MTVTAITIECMVDLLELATSFVVADLAGFHVVEVIDAAGQPFTLVQGSTGALLIRE